MPGDPLLDSALLFLCHGAEAWIMRAYDVMG